MVNSSEEDELREEDGCHQILVDAVDVGAQSAEDRQKQKGDEEGHQRSRYRGVSDHFERKNITMLKTRRRRVTLKRFAFTD